MLAGMRMGRGMEISTDNGRGKVWGRCRGIDSSESLLEAVVRLKGKVKGRSKDKVRIARRYV